jgi:PAS domain S-box-containing protein
MSVADRPALRNREAAALPPRATPAMTDSPAGMGYDRAEIATLVGRLQETEKRLRELLGDGIDAVIYPDGQSYLLWEAREHLRRSEERFRGIFSATVTGIAVATPKGRYLQANPAYCRMLGYTEDELRTRDFASLTHPDDLALNLHLLNEVLAGRRDSFIMEKRYWKKNGDIQWIRGSVSAAYAASGEVETLVLMAEDIGERKLAESRLARLNRLHAVLSGTGEAIMRARDRQTLYDAVCRIVVEVGLLRMAFIAELDGESGLARPAASFGAGLDYLAESTGLFPTDGGPLSQGPVGTALRTGVFDVCNDIGADPRMKPWHEATLKSGLLAIAAFPLTLRGATVGVMCLYAGETDYFLDDEIALMVTVANNLSFALEALDVERQRQQAEIRSIQLAAIVESSEDAIIGQDLDCVVTSWNKGAENLFGYSAEEMTGNSIMRLVPADRHDEERRVLDLIRRGESVKNLETRRQAGDGRLIEVSVTASPIRNAAGAVTGVSKVTRDITQAKKSERRFRRLVDSNAHGVFFWNAKGEIDGANDAFLHLVRYTQEDLGSGRLNWSAITPPEYADRDRRAREEIAAKGVCASYEKEFLRSDGSRVPVIVGAAVFEDDPGDGVCFVVDLSERRKLEQQLGQAQKMEAIGQLTGGMAHDFNNLLAVILGNLGFLARKFPAGSDERELTEEATRAARHGAELTRALLAFARRQPLAPKVTDLTEAIETAGRLFQRTLGEDLKLEVKLETPLWPVLIDVAQIEAALLNLAVNARDAMPGGGTLTIEARNITLDEGAANLNPEAKPGNFLVVSVSDTGTGMPPEVLAKAFDPFFTTKGTAGTGLGLSMVHGFVKQSGGFTRIYSEPGKGTTVNICLPRAADGTAEAPAEHGSRTPPTGHETILVVEDNKPLRNLVIRQLNDFGYLTISAGDAAKALDVISRGEPVDLLFTDVVMPGDMDGRALAAAARALRPGLKVLFTSGFTAAAASAALASDLDAALLSKPYSADDLARRVRAAIDGTA